MIRQWIDIPIPANIVASGVMELYEQNYSTKLLMGYHRIGTDREDGEGMPASENIISNGNLKKNEVSCAMSQ